MPTDAEVGVMAMLVSVAGVGVPLLLLPPPPPQAATAILQNITKSNLVILNFYLPDANLRLDRFTQYLHITLREIIIKNTLRYKLLRIG